MKIYCRPHRNRHAENEFFDFLLESFPGAEHLNERFPLKGSLLSRPVFRDALVQCLKADALLPSNAKASCLEALKLSPEQIYVTTNPDRISVDMVLVQSSTPVYVEFHEKQHRLLSDNRPKNVYDIKGNTYPVPRGLQRLVRDVWRCLYLKPFCIVWKDWFETGGEVFILPSANSFEEFVTPDKFSFQDFLQPYLNS
ncbi:hypothetical protein [Pelobacter seleniigenes]|uniref:hypothetical protein n=1 Tax=Pelobacter seleniigenes TaxID=407188 RepID=UPI0004A70526|nr:hypothetical protein [Pelobacter seleniigenes]